MGSFQCNSFQDASFQTNCAPATTTGGHAKATQAQIRGFRARQDEDLRRLHDDNEALLLLLEEE